MARTFAWGTILLASLLLINLPHWAQSFRLDSSFSDKLIEDGDQFTCAQSCSSSESSKQIIEYQTGTTYSYQVELSTKLNGKHDSADSNNQVRIEAIADLSVYKPCEMVLRLRQVKVDGIEDERQATEMKTQLESYSTHFAVQNGKIEHVCVEQVEPEWTVNIKKSIVSSIQVSAKSLTENTSVLETDINGQCVTEYHPENEWRYGQDKTAIVQIVKSKQLSKCNKRHQINLGLFPRSYGLDQLIRSSMPIVNGTYECRQKIQDGIVIDSDCCDKQTIWPLKVTVDSDIRCRLIGEQSALTVPKSTSRSMKRQNLIWNTAFSRQNLVKGSLQSPDNDYTVEQVEQLLQQICMQIKDSIKIQVPEMFAELIHAKQSLNVDDEQRIYEQIQSGQICPSFKLMDLYLDASALSGTAGSVQVLIQAYEKYQQQQQDQRDILPRFSYLFSLLAFTKTPNVEAAQRLVQFVQQEQQRTPVSQDFEQIIYGVTGYIHNLRQYTQDQEQQQQQQEQSISWTDVEPVIGQLQQQLINHVEQLMPQVDQQSQQVDYSTVLSLIHGLENIGYELPSNYRQQQQLVRRMIQLCQKYNARSQGEYYSPIRAAIIRSIVNVADDEQIRNYLLEVFFDQQQQEPNVVRIEAYKTLVMSGVKISELQKIQEYVDSDSENRSVDLINYVRSHQANLRTTSDIYRRSILPLGAPKFAKPSSMFGVSRNYEFSYLNDVYQMGVTAETDVIYDSQRQSNSIPKMISFNLTLPIMGREFQAVQLRVHQNGLEQVLGDKYQQLMAGQSSKQLDPIKLFGKLIDLVSQDGEQLLRQNPEFSLLVQVQVDGKTVVLCDQNELMSLVKSSGKIGELFRNVFNREQSNLSIDRAYSIVPIDFVTSMTTSSGMPVQVQVNSTVVVGLKTDINFNVDRQGSSDVEVAIWPSFAGQVEARVQYYAGQQAKSIQHVARVYSAPHVNLIVKVDDQQGVSIKSTMPEQKYTVIRYETGFYVDQQVSRSSFETEKRSLSSSSDRESEQHRCTEFTKRSLGVALCYDVAYENDDRQNRFVAEVSVQKFDHQLNSFELHLDNPVSFWKSISGSSSRLNGAKRSLKFIFNTPGSRIDRETSFELQLPTFDREAGLLSTGARLKIKSPWKQMLAEAVIRNHQSERSVSVQLSLDKHRYVQMQMNFEMIKRGQKTEYQTKMILDTPITGQPINLVGVLSYQQGRKSVFYISLQDVEQQRHFIKSTIVKTGRFDQGDLKCSAHLMLDLAGVACKAIGTIERGVRDLKLDFSTDYETESSGRQSARLLVKHQDLSWGKMIKLINQAQFSSSQAPKYNAQYDHQLTYGSNEYLEHDLQLKWNRNEEQIRCYQSVKMTEQRGQYDGEAETIFMVKPMKIDYQLKAQASLIGLGMENGETKRYEIIATGHKRDHPEQDKIRAELSYQQQSSKPLKMNVRAAVKSDNIDFVYSDNVEEQQPNQYQGHMMVQLSPEQKYSSRYIYAINKKDSQLIEHQLDATFDDEISKKLTAKHHGKLRLIPNQLFDMETKWTNEQNEDLFDGRLKWENEGKTECQFEHHPSETRGEFDLDLYSSPSKANVEFENKQYKHSTKVDYDNMDSLFTLRSKTKSNNDDIFSIDSQISPKRRSHLAIDSEAFTSDCHYEPESESGSRSEKSAKIQFHLPGSWQHESRAKINCDDGRYQLQSKTDYNDKNVFDLNGEYHRNQAVALKMKTRSTFGGLSAEKDKQYRVQFKNDRFKHDTRFDCERPDSIEFESKTTDNGENVAAIQYGCNQDKVHELKVDCDRVVRAKGQCQWHSNEPFANFNVDWLAGESPIHHETQIKANRRDQSARLDSKTKLSDQKVAQIKAAIAKNPADQQPFASASIELPQFDAQIGYEQQTNRLDDQDKQHKISCSFDGKQWKPEWKHQSQIKILKKRSIIEFESKTESKHDKNNHLQLKGQYRHLDEQQPSHLDVKLGNILSAVGQINLFNQKEKSLDIQSKYDNGRRYEHESQVKYWPEKSSMKWDGKISNEIGRKIASIESFISTDADKTSYLKVDSEDKKQVPRIKIELNRRMKRAAIDFDMDQFQHQTLIHDDQSAVKVNTITTKDQQNIFNFNTEINRQPSTKSHFHVKVGPKYETAFHVYPAKRSGGLSMKTPALRHQTEFDLNNQIDGPANMLQSATYYHDNLLANLDARMEGLRSENIIKADVPGIMRLDTTMDAPGKRFSFDAQADSRYGGRHAMGSIYANHVRRNVAGLEDRQFHFDLAWDVDRDPRSRVLVDVSAQRQPDQSVQVVVRADYAHNKLIFETEMMPRSVFAHSARMSLSYVPYGDIDSFQVIYTHINRLPQVECKFDFMFRGQLKYSARMTSQLTDERFVIGFQTTSPQNLEAQVNMNVMGVAKGPGQYYFKGSVQRAVEDQYEVEATLEQDADNRVYYGKVEVRVPKMESQSFEYRIDYPGRYIAIHTVNPQSGGRFELEAQAPLNQDLKLSLKSDVAYLPVIDGKISYSVSEPEFHAKLDFNQERLIEAQYKLTGIESIGSGRFHLLAKWQSVFTPSFEVSGSSGIEQQANGQENLVFTIEGKYNAEKIFYGQLKRVSSQSDAYGKQSIVFDMQGWISRPNGVKLIRTASKFALGQNRDSFIEYVLDVEPNRDELETIEPVYVIINGARKPGESDKLIGSIKISKGQERRDWLDCDVVIEQGNRYYQNEQVVVNWYGMAIVMPERIMTTVRYVPTSTQATFQVSFMEQLDVAEQGKTLFDEQSVQPQLRNLRAMRKYRNQMVATLDDQKIGYEVISTKLAYRNTWEHSVRLYSPQSNGRSVQYRTGYHYSPETFTYVYRSELKYGYQSEQPIYTSTQVIAPIPNKPTSYMVYYDLHSSVLSGDGHVWARAFLFGPENKYQGLIATVKTTQNDQITFEATARTEEEQANQLVYYGQTNKVTYYNVSLYTQDQQIDSGVDGYVSGNGLELNWHNQNRYGHRQTGQYRFRFLDNKQFEAVMEHNNNGYYCKGQLRPKQDVYVVDTVVEQYEKVVSSGKYYYNQHAPQQMEKRVKGQYKIHVEAKDQCIRAEIVRDSASVDSKYEQRSPLEGSYTQQLSFCMEDDKSNILNVAIDSIENGQKTTDLNVRLDTREVVNSIILSLKWNPRYEQTYYGQIYEQLRHGLKSEVSEEIRHVVRTLRRILYEQQDGINRYQVLAERLVQSVEDFFGLDAGEMQQLMNELVTEPIISTLESLYRYGYEYGYIVEQYQQKMKQLVRKVEYECYQSDVCRQSVEAVVEACKTPERFVSMVSDYLVQALQHTHRVVSTSYSGRLIRSFIPATFYEYLPELIHQINHYFIQSYTKLVHGNYPLADFINNLEHVSHEMMVATHWRQVQWHQVKEAIGNMIELTVSPWRYISTTRVLVYDPQQGQLQIELYGPAVKHPRYYYKQIIRPILSHRTDALNKSQSSYEKSGYYYPSSGEQSSSILSQMFGRV